MRGWFERGVRGGNAEYAEVFWGVKCGVGVRGWFSRVERGERVEGALRAILGNRLGEEPSATAWGAVPPAAR